MDRERPAIVKPVFVIGAARSGTKLLRGMVASHPAFSAVPYDVNFIWKYGNYTLDHDELTPTNLTPKIGKFITTSLARFQTPDDHRIVEKTVSNTLRVEFVRALFPDCSFLHLIRDGRDVAASARRMWLAPMNRRESLRKLRNLPLSGMPTYGLSYLMSYARRRVDRERRVASWGPRFRGIDEVARTRSLLETCGVQWQRSVELASAALAGLPSDTVCEVRYEELARDPETQLRRIFEFIGLDHDAPLVARAAAGTTASKIGSWQDHIGEHERADLMKQIGPTLDTLGYG